MSEVKRVRHHEGGRGTTRKLTTTVGWGFSLNGWAAACNTA